MSTVQTERPPGPTEKQVQTMIKMFKTLSGKEASFVIAELGGVINNKVQWSQKKKADAEAAGGSGISKTAS